MEDASPLPPTATKMKPKYYRHNGGHVVLVMLFAASVCTAVTEKFLSHWISNLNQTDEKIEDGIQTFWPHCWGALMLSIFICTVRTVSPPLSPQARRFLSSWVFLWRCLLSTADWRRSASRRSGLVCDSSTTSPTSCTPRGGCSTSAPTTRWAKNPKHLWCLSDLLLKGLRLKRIPTKKDLLKELKRFCFYVKLKCHWRWVVAGK